MAGCTDPGGHYRVYEHIASGRKAPFLFATAEDGHHEVHLCEMILKNGVAKRWTWV